MEEDEPLARAGKTYLQDLAFTDQSTTDETLEAIDRYFDRPYYNLTEDELARFAKALAAAGLDLLRLGGLPTDLGDINDLEEVFHSHCRHQPRKPYILKSTVDHEKALADWKEAHSAYWKELRDEPEVNLFTDEKLIAAYRMQAVSAKLVEALLSKHPAMIFAESMKLTMLAIRSGVFYLVSREGKNIHSNRVKRKTLKRSASKAGLESGKSRNKKANPIHEAIKECYRNLPLAKQRISPGANVERTLARSAKWDKQWEFPSRSTINSVISKLKNNLPTNGKP